MGSKRLEKNEYERKRKRKKRKISSDDEITEYSINKLCKKACEVANMMRSCIVSRYTIYYSELAGKFVWDKKMTDDDLTESLINENMHELSSKEKREKNCYFDQCKAGSEIRLSEGRIKPIDILSMHLDEPYLAFESLSVKDMEELRKDIVVHLDLDRATPTRIRYWEALRVVCEWELAEARKKEDLEEDRVCREKPFEESGLNASTEADVKNLLQGKSLGELEVIQSEIELQIHIYKAKACLKELHDKILRTN